MKCDIAENVRVLLPESALTVVFDECDGFEQDETGGRVIGTYKKHGDNLTLSVTGIIESGPAARRSPVSFFQDGEYQERIFREIEGHHPEQEHLGNWHTHHVNGLATLSGGDIATYGRTVNHKNHNTSFFYAFLVTAKHKGRNPRQRYSIKHYLFRRDDDRFYEIPAGNVEITDSPLLWPAALAPAAQSKGPADPHVAGLGVRPERVYDRDILGEFYQAFRPFASNKLGFYWRGSLELVDGSKVQVVLLENLGASPPTYSVALRDPADSLKIVEEELARQEFPSARAALMLTERTCNRALYHQRGALREANSEPKK